MEPDEQAGGAGQGPAAPTREHDPSVAFGIAFAQHAEGGPTAHLDIHQATVVTCRELAEADPGRYLPDLGTALYNFAYPGVELARPAEALPHVQEAVTIFRELAAASSRYLS